MLSNRTIRFAMNKTASRLAPKLATVLSAAYCLLASLSANAQDAEEYVFTLSPFQVDSSQDVGYRATNTISGSRLNTAIKDIPMPIEVITREFIDDTGALDLKEALQYSAGIVRDELQAPAFGTVDFQDPHKGKNEARIKIRGFETTVSLRNGFRRTHGSDTANIGRVEIVRGPAALLYGIGNFGGIVNYSTKRPSAEQQQEVTLMVGSDNMYRVGYEATGPLSEAFGFRINAVRDDRDDWTDFNTRTVNFISPVFEYKPNEKTTVLLDLEYEDVDRIGIGFTRLGNSASGTSAERDVARELPSPRPSTFRWSGPDTTRAFSNHNALIEATHQINDQWAFLVAANQSKFDYDSGNIVGTQIVSDQGPSEIWKPSHIARSEGGGTQEFVNASLRYWWETQSFVTDTQQYRAEATYEFEVGENLHRILFGTLHQTTDSHTKENDSTEMFYHGIEDYSYFRWDNQFGGSPVFRPVKNQEVRDTDQGYYFVYQGDLFNDRVHVVAGLRHDRNDSRVTDRDPDTEAVEDISWRLSGPSEETSPQIGITYGVNDSLSVYALQSSGLFPVYGKTDGAGKAFDPTTADSLEAGIKFDLIENKLSGTISAFKIERENTTRFVWWAPAPKRNNQRGGYDESQPLTYWLWGGGDGSRSYYWDNEENTVDPERTANDRQHILDYASEGNWMGTGNRSDSFGVPVNNPSVRNRGTDVAVDDKSKGWDFQLIFSPEENWQTTFSFAHVEREITHGARFVDLPYSKLAPVDLWIARSSDNGRYGGGPDAFEDPLRASTYSGNLNNGESLDDTPENAASLYNNYRFIEGPLTGLSIGFGVQWEDEREYISGSSSDGSRLFDENDPDKPRSSKIKDKTNVNFTLGYRKSFDNGTKLHLQLNVYNLFDDTQRYGRSYNRPRYYRLSSKFSF